MPSTPESLPDRFWRYVNKTDTCWPWIGATNRKGYGVIQIDYRRKLAHAWSWLAANGPLGDGLVIDHLCRVRHCVNPAHLRAVTSRENTMAPGSLALAKACSERTHCPHGHEYSPENTRVMSGKRRCVTCMTIRHRKRSRERSLARLAAKENA